MSQFASLAHGANDVLVINKPIACGIHWIRGDYDDRVSTVWCPKQLPATHPEYRTYCYICYLASVEPGIARKREITAFNRTLWPVFVINRTLTQLSNRGWQEWLIAGFRLSQDITFALAGRPSYAMNIVRQGQGLKTEYPVYRFSGAYPTFERRGLEDMPDLPILSEAAMASLFHDPYTLDHPAWLYQEEEVA